jgi:hypothetical protein
MSSLLVSDDWTYLLVYSLHNFKSLVEIAYAKQFLDHIISIFVHNQIWKLHIQSLNDLINLSLTCLI